MRGPRNTGRNSIRSLTGADSLRMWSSIGASNAHAHREIPEPQYVVTTHNNSRLGDSVRPVVFCGKYDTDTEEEDRQVCPPQAHSSRSTARSALGLCPSRTRPSLTSLSDPGLEGSSGICPVLLSAS
jgi:hypothetical protein